MTAAQRTPAEVRAINEVNASLESALPALRRQMIALCKDVPLAEDLVQEAATKALENAGKYAEGTNFEAWLYTIAKNHYLSSIRKLKREVGDDGEIAGQVESGTDAQQHATRLTELLAAINKLPAHMRQAIRLVGILGYSYEQAAERCKCDIGTVKSRVSRARLLLGEHGRTPRAEKAEREVARGLPVGGNDGSFLYALAKKYLEENDGEVARATDALVERLTNDRSAMEEVAAAAIREAMRTYASHVLKHRREKIVNRADAGRGAVVALAAGISAALLDMPLSGGVKLRQASRELVLEEADRLDIRAKEAKRRANWLRLIAQSIPNGRCVGDVMDDARAQELWNECKK